LRFALDFFINKCYNIKRIIAKRRYGCMRSSFKRLFGNERSVAMLSHAVLSDTLSHALLIVGPKGSGRHTLATELAAALLCENKNNGSVPLPCTDCRNCRRIYSGNFPDLSYLKREQGKATIGADEVRAFREDMFLSSTEAEKKVYIISEAEALTPQAQNALLKVLEEPPRNVHIFLISSNTDSMLSTIKSRTQLIQTEIFDPDREEELVCRISDSARALRASDQGKLRSVILSSGGVIGNALVGLDERQIAESEQRRARVMALVLAMPGKAPFSKIYSAVTALPDKRADLRILLEDTVTAISDMLISKKCENIAPRFFISGDECREASAAISAQRLTAIYDVFARAIEDLDKNVLISPLLTDIAVAIKEAEKGK
jgi:DNA polymerase-3 subunit delta'